MNKRLQHYYENIENQRQSLLLPLRKVPHERLNHQPDGKWSINQIIAHLISAENLSLQYLNKKILGVQEAKDTGLLEEAKMLLLSISQRMPLKFKAPRVVVEHTARENDFEKLAQAWDLSRSELEGFLNRMDDQHLKRKIYKHVRVGMLNVQHALKFFGEHVAHHAPQIKKLLKEK
jgi:uncharacterized damage-inducible protein DinB